MFEALAEHWELVAAVFLFVLGHFRTEWRVNALEKDIDRIEEERKKDRDALWDKVDVLRTEIGDVKESLARIEGYLKAPRDHGV